MGGIDKAFLTLDGKTLIDRKLELLTAAGFTCIYIVTNKPDHYKQFEVTLVQDREVGMGPLMGLYSGLKVSTAESNLVTTVDTPFLAPRLVKRLDEQLSSADSPAKDADALVTTWRGMTEPLLAVYKKSCIPAIEASFPRRRIISFYDKITVHYYPEEEVRAADPDGLSFFNINSWEEYEAAKEIAASLVI
jgi:molybdopterin-guanine dinucleotide biosynthesis protein A